jgi:hypothetical protein
MLQNFNRKQHGFAVVLISIINGPSLNEVVDKNVKYFLFHISEFCPRFMKAPTFRFRGSGVSFLLSIMSAFPNSRADQLQQDVKEFGASHELRGVCVCCEMMCRA